MKATYTIHYEGKNVTNDLSDVIESITFTDVLEGRAGSLAIEIADHEKKFLGSWFPRTNDRIQVWLGVEGKPLLDAQKFWVDEVSFRGSRDGNRCTIRALSTPPANVVKGANRKAVGDSLSQLANSVSNALGLTLKGDFKGKVFGNQNSTDLGFLMQQCNRNGYILKVENGNLIAYQYSTLRNRAGLTISLNDVIDWSYEGKAEGRFAKCVVKWFDAKTKKSYSGSSTLEKKGGGTATIWEEVDSNEDAEKRAKHWLENREKKEVEITIRTVGDVRLLAGVAVELKDAGSIGGKHIIKEATHTISRDGGYETEIKLQK